MKKLHQINDNNNFIYLLIAISTLLFSSAVSDDFPGSWGEDIFSFVMVAMLIIGVKSLHTNINIRPITYSLAIILGILNLLWTLYPCKWSAILILLTMLLAFIGAFKLSVKKILFEGVVDSNKIIGSLSLYLLIGLIWTSLYMILLLFEPTSFNGIEIESWRTLFSRVAYYSFVTLTTLGYGDISPANHIAEFLVYMEAIAGVFYMAIFVSSLINLHGTNLSNSESKKER